MWLLPCSQKMISGYVQPHWCRHLVFHSDLLQPTMLISLCQETERHRQLVFLLALVITKAQETTCASLIRFGESNKPYRRLVPWIMATGTIKKSMTPPTYNTFTDITSTFPSRPTSGSTQTYTVPNDGYIYLFADSGGWTLFIDIDGTERFQIPAYVNPTAVTFVLPVAKGQVIRLYTNNSAASWSIRQVLYFQ